VGAFEQECAVLGRRWLWDDARCACLMAGEEFGVLLFPLLQSSEMLQATLASRV